MADNITKLIALERYLTDYPFGIRILDDIPDACIITDHEQKIIFTNRFAEALFGYYRGELVGNPIEILIPERYRRAHAAHRQAYMLEPKPRSMGLLLKTPGLKKDGTEFDAEISLAPIVVPDGFFVIATVRVARDGIESRMRRAEKESGRDYGGA